MDGLTLLIASYAALVSTGVAVVQWKEARRIARIREAMKRPPVKPVPVVTVNRDRERVGVAIEDSIPIPDDPDGHHTVGILVGPGTQGDALLAECEIGYGTYRFSMENSGLKKGDTLALKIMTDAPDLEISTLTGSDASQAYLEARKQEARA